MPAPMLHRPREFLSPRPHGARGGFTLIELLVVIVVMAILGGLILVGISAVGGTTRDRSTETRLQTLNNMMAAFANAENARGGGLGNVEANALPSVLQAIPNPQPADEFYYSTFDGFSDPDQLQVLDRNREREPLRAPALFTEDSWIANRAVARTQAVLRRLVSVPANQSTYASLPEDARTRDTATNWEGTASLLNHLDRTLASSPLDPALMLDGHGRVILYVPPEGLTDLKFADGTQLDFNSSNPAQSPRLVAADGGPFWASAGPDGNFQTGDDNVYSTQVVVRNPAAGTP